MMPTDGRSSGAALSAGLIVAKAGDTSPAQVGRARLSAVPLTGAVSPARRSSSDNLPSSAATPTFSACSGVTSSMTERPPCAFGGSMASMRRFCAIVSLTERRASPSELKFCVRTTSTRSPGLRRPVPAPTEEIGIAIARAPEVSTTCRNSRSPGLTISERRIGSPRARSTLSAAPETSLRACSSRSVCTAASGRTTVPGSTTPAAGRHTTSSERSSVPAASGPAATSTSSFGVGCTSAVAFCGNACRNSQAATPSDSRNRIVSSVLARMA